MNQEMINVFQQAKEIRLSTADCAFAGESGSNLRLLEDVSFPDHRSLFLTLAVNTPDGQLCGP